MIRHVINFVTFAAAVLFADPKDATVEANEWAQFNCTVQCDYHISWYMAGFPNAIKRNNTVSGLLIKRRRDSTCTGSGEKTLFFLKFLPQRHSISQHFTALQMKDALKRIAAVVEQKESVTAGLPSLQVSMFGMLCLCFCKVHFRSNACM